LSFVPRDPHVEQLRAFFDAVARRQQLPIAEALGTLVVLDAIASGVTTLA
jgi:hypothetical protein